MVATQILLVAVAAVALAILAHGRRIQAPLLLTAIGLLVSFAPGLTRPELAPETILGIVVPPLLYSAALNFSLFSFMKRITSILNLGVALVFVTALAASFAMICALPAALSLPAALILGAVIAPPDAVSATSIGRELGLSRRLMTILKGESLINDAAALALFTVVVAIATRHPYVTDNPELYFIYATGVGAVVGLGLGFIVHRVRRHTSSASLTTVLSLLTPFAAYSMAEELGASGIIAVVLAGFSLGYASAELDFAGRIREREVWRVVDTLLEAFVFAYVGLQLRFVIDEALDSGISLAFLGRATLMLLTVVVVVRIGWIFSSSALDRRLYLWRARRAARRDKPAPDPPLGWRENLVLGWSGMRGVVTVAAAAGTPLLTTAGEPLPGRETIVVLAFLVAVGTLLLQGLTLPWLIRALGVDNETDKDYERAQQAYGQDVLRRAMVDALNELRGRQTSEADIRVVEASLRRAQRAVEIFATQADGGSEAARNERMLEIARAVLAAQRGALIRERDALRLDDEIVREMLEGIDMEQAVIARRSAPPK